MTNDNNIDSIVEDKNGNTHEKKCWSWQYDHKIETMKLWFFNNEDQINSQIKSI